MMAFVILAGGRGTRIGRVGESLHKCLVPLNGKAIISHQIALAPSDAHIIINTGFRAEQIRTYMALAHPDLKVTYVHTENWDQPGAGPGTGLLACREAVGHDDMIFTSCDTLWSTADYDKYDSWVGVAPVPAGTPPARWCRMQSLNTYVTKIIDKDPMIIDAYAYTGMGRIHQHDLLLFWMGIEDSHLTAGELQITGGLDILSQRHMLHSQRIDWTDVGDEESYKHAVSRHSGFDWSKLGQATWVLPETGQVVKFHKDRDVIIQRVERAKQLEHVTPKPITFINGDQPMMSYPYVRGISAYDACDVRVGVTQDLLQWWHDNFWSTRYPSGSYSREAAMRFYRDKTFERIAMLPTDMRARALDEVTRINWPTLVNDVIPGSWHGDLNAGNVVVHTPMDKELKFTAIDWRENFAGELEYGDLRYDLAKLLAGTVVHWDNARRGDFRPWQDAPQHATEIRRYVKSILNEDAARQIEIIGALSLLNSSPLHASPLDEILVSRGCSWLEEVL